MNDTPTRRRVLVASGLATALGLGGCLRLSQSDSQQAAGTPVESPTATAVAVQTESGDGSGGYPPGVSEDGVSETLVLSHRQAVTNTSRTVESKYMFERRTTRTDGERFLVTGDRAPDSYIADGKTYQRIETADGPIYGYRNDIPREYRPEALTGTGVLSALIAGGNFRPVGTQRTGGQTNTLIEADSVSDQASLRSADNISRYFRESEFPLTGFSGSGVVTQQGVIRELSAFLEGDGDSGEFLVRTTEIGSTDVPVPSWTTTAKEQAAQFDASLVDDGTYIRAEQVAGQSLDTAFEIGAYDGEYYDGEYTGSSSVGTVFFLYKTDEEDQFGSKKLGISKGSRPSESPAGSWSGRVGWNLSVRNLRIVDSRDVA